MQVNTGIKDKEYDLLSVLYHTLQSCKILGKYEEDARLANDPELVRFFHELQEADLKRASQTKRLLLQCAQATDEASEEVDIEDEEQFEQIAS